MNIPIYTKDEMDQQLAKLSRMREALEDAGKWLRGQPARATCKAQTLNELIANIDATLASTPKGKVSRFLSGE